MEHAFDIRRECNAFLAKTTQDTQQIVHKVRIWHQVVIEADYVKLGRTVKHHPYLPWFLWMVDTCMRYVIDFTILNL